MYTKDGYILDLWHAWDPKASQRYQPNGDKKVVFMQHGLVDTAGTWFFTEPEKSVAYTLAHEGFDLWIGNNRGTVYSDRHVKYTTKDAAFWNYTFHEMAEFDLPANLDFVLNKTGVEKVTYFGHSQGTIQFWIGNIMYDDIGSKVDQMIAMAPVMYLNHMVSPAIEFCFTFHIDTFVETYLNSFLFSSAHLLAEIGPRFIELLPRTVWSGVETIVGIDKASHMSPERMPMMAKNDIGGTGTHNLKHWAQNIKTKKFADMQGNLYDVSKLVTNLNSTELLLVDGANDAFSEPADCAMLEKLLPQHQLSVLRLDDYNHLDYMWADDSDKLVNPHVFDFMAKDTYQIE